MPLLSQICHYMAYNIIQACMPIYCYLYCDLMVASNIDCKICLLSSLITPDWTFQQLGQVTNWIYIHTN